MARYQSGTSQVPSGTDQREEGKSGRPKCGLLRGVAWRGAGDMGKFERRQRGTTSEGTRFWETRMAELNGNGEEEDEGEEKRWRWRWRKYWTNAFDGAFLLP